MQHARGKNVTLAVDPIRILVHNESTKKFHRNSENKTTRASSFFQKKSLVSGQRPLLLRSHHDLIVRGKPLPLPHGVKVLPGNVGHAKVPLFSLVLPLLACLGAPERVQFHHLGHKRQGPFRLLFVSAVHRSCRRRGIHENAPAGIELPSGLAAVYISIALSETKPHGPIPLGCYTSNHREPHTPGLFFFLPTRKKKKR